MPGKSEQSVSRREMRVSSGKAFPMAKRWFVLACWLSLIAASSTTDDAQQPRRAYDGIKNTTQLFTRILNKEWGLALERLEEEPGEASILVEQRDRTGAFSVRLLPLQQVFAGDLPKESDPSDEHSSNETMSEEQFQVIKRLFRLNPRATIQKDLNKRTLLHLAVGSRLQPPVAVIHAFIKANPHSLKSRDADDRLPLHTAVASPMTSFDNVEAILSSFMWAVNATDEDDAIPLHLAAWGGSGPQAVKVIRLLVENNPSSLLLKDGDDETVLTLMSKYGRTSTEALAFVLQQDPKAVLRDRDEREGNTPLHYAVSASLGTNSKIYQPILKSDSSAAEKINKVGKLPLHVALGQCCVSLEHIRDLINAYPLGATLRDGEGYTPLHQASEAGVSDIEVIKLLLASSPMSLRQTASIKQDLKGPLPLHLALRSHTESYSMNQVIDLFLKEYPEAARIKDPDTKLAPLPAALMSKRPVEILRKLMLLDPDSINESFEVMEEGKAVRSSAFHLLASIGPTYLAEKDMEVIVKDFLVMDPNGAARKDGKGRTPLHIVWKDPLRATQEQVSRQTLSDALMVAHSDVVKVTDDEGRPPVAYASVQRDDTAVSKMLDLFPEGAEIKSKDGSFPLHYACGLGQVQNESGAIDAIILRLLKAYPEAASETNDESELPLHRVCESAGTDHFSPETVRSLVKTYSEASRRRDKQGNLPLAIAVNNAVECEQPVQTEYWLGLIDTLIQSYPGAVSDQDVRGRTPFSSALQIMDSLSHTRRQENDPVLKILIMLYGLYPQAVLKKDGAQKTGLHFIAQLFGDLGGMIPSAWKDFAIRVMRDYPELLNHTDKNARTPLHVFILYLGDTAIGSRDNQDPRTRMMTQEIEEFLATMMALCPAAINLREEYNLTPLDLINHKRLRNTHGSGVYGKSPIINAVTQFLMRDEEYWEMAGRLERANIALGVTTTKENIKCIGIRQSLLSLQEQILSKLQHEPISNDTGDENASCPEATETQSQSCDELIPLIEKIREGLHRLASANGVSQKQT